MHKHKPISVFAECFFSVQVCHCQFLFMQVPFMIGNLALAFNACSQAQSSDKGSF